MFPYASRGKDLLLPLLFAFMFFPLYPGEGQETEDDFSGDELPFMEDEGITITGTRETTQQIRTIGREDIERLHAPDLPALLEQALNLVSVRYGPYGSQADISIRGFDSERVAVLVNGVPASSPLSGDFDFSTIDVNSIEKIEVIYGGSDTTYNISGAMGGVLNIVTVPEGRQKGRIGGSVSNTSAMPGIYYDGRGKKTKPQWQDLLDAQRLGFFASREIGDFSLSADWFGVRAANHYLVKNYHGITRRKEHNEVWDSGFSASLVWNLPDYTKLIAQGSVYYGDKNFPAAAVSNIFENQRDFSSRENLMLKAPRILSDSLAAEFSASHSLQRLDHRAGGEDSLHRIHTLQFISRWAWYPAGPLVVRTGGDYRYSRLDSTGIGARAGQGGGIYITAEYTPLKKLLVVSSVKVNFNGGKDMPFAAVPLPKFGLAFFAAEWLTVKNNYFRSFKFPDFEDLYWDQAGYYGNPDLKPEDAWGTDLGAALRFGALFNMESTVYVQETDNSIHWSNSSGRWRPENTARAVFFGWDSRAGFEIPVSLGPVKKIVPSVSYKFLLTYVLTGSSGEHMGFAAGVRIPYAPVHTAGLSVELPWETGSLLVSGNYTGFRYAGYTSKANTRPLDPGFLLTVTVNQKAGKNLSAFAVFRNILDQSCVSFDDYPMPGFTATVGLRLEFEM
ncbi:MAG: TonB-dependent receptor [Treponema sp.]|jgi:vitamin B12 transporter|nr:TonB-dependent receptor [Treponema sp.]